MLTDSVVSLCVKKIRRAQKPDRMEVMWKGMLMGQWDVWLLAIKDLVFCGKVWRVDIDQER